MQRILLRYVWLVLVAWGLAVTPVHAAELSVCIDEPVAFETGHSVGDGDETPADAGKDAPHHHSGCHCHHTADVRSDDGRSAIVAATTSPAMLDASFTRVAVHDPALRPPIA